MGLIDVVQLREKFAFRITSFATQHSFATNNVQLRNEMLQLMMVVLMMVTFHDDC